MQTQSRKPRPAGTAAFISTHTDSKRFPPFGKRLDEIRKRGLIPNRRVIVATDWSIGKLYPRIIVTPDAPVSSLRFNYLSGLHVPIFYFDCDEPIMSVLVAEILAIQPATLATFNMSAVKRGEPAFKLIYSKFAMEGAA